MKDLRLAFCLRDYLNCKQLIKRAKCIAVITLALTVFVYGSALPAYSRGGAGNFNQTYAPGLNEWMQILANAPTVKLAINPTNPYMIYAGADIGSIFRTTDSGASWNSSTTPANGYVVSLAIDFVNPNNVFVATSAGVFKSTDGGASWPTQSSPNATYMVMDPQTPNILYASAGIANMIWKTTDSGASWLVLPTGDIRLSPARWAISPSNPQIIYAPGANPSLPGIGLYKSSNGGAIWSPTGLDVSGLNNIAVDPFNPDVVYASTFQQVFKSTDGGASWLDMSEGLVLFLDSEITSIAISPTSPNNLYVGTFSYDVGNGVFQSTNGGISWSAFNEGMNYPYILDLAMDSSGTNLYAATFEGVYRYQFAENCAAQIAPNLQSFSASGGAGSVNVTTNSACRWSVLTSAEWITITSPASGTGSDIVTYEVRENLTVSPRTSTIVIAGQNFTVAQGDSLGESCEYFISPAAGTYSALGGTGMLNVSTASYCVWQAVSQVSWITITSPASGIGSREVTFTVAANPTGQGRKGKIIINGQPFKVKQKGGG